MSISKADILQQVKDRQLTPEQGLKLYRELERAESGLADAPAAEIGYLPSDIAVIGMSARIPGANNLQEIWSMLSAGKDAVGEVPESRWQREAAETDRKKWGAFLSDIDGFDPLFFEISPKEAEQMDPQQRLLLQESWKAFEDAGHPQEALQQKSCCVFVGCTQGDYLSESGIDEINPHSLTGRSISAVAARISYFFNLRGPSLVINTACSSSLAALVTACERLRGGSSDMALVGGISVMSSRTAHTTMDQVGMISPGGKCRTFDRDADGIVPGEAVGAVVLKRMADAVADRDRILGVIRGYGINHDGRTNGLTAPSGPAQTALLSDIYRRFNIDPNTISYVEAHGTGTKLGDPIEVHALIDAFADYRVPEKQCALGSIKTNIGHTLEAAGLIGVIKVLLCLQRQKLVPSLHYEHANEHIAFAGSPFYVNTQLQDWRPNGIAPLRAGVSAFGMSGTNAHVVVEAAPTVNGNTAVCERPYYLFPLSAKTPTALQQRIGDLQQWLAQNAGDPSFSLADAAYTLQVGRSHFAFREAVVAADVRELQEQLSDLLRRDADWSEPERLPSAEQKRLKQTANDSLREAAGSKPDRNPFEALADCYRQGLNLDWRSLYLETMPRRIALPNYPFADEHYWLNVPPKTESQLDANHSPVQRNTSDLSEQHFSKRLTGDEFFLADHLVAMPGQAERKVLPAVVYLEMARAAISEVCGLQNDTGIVMTDIAWLQPLYADRAQDLHIRINGQADKCLHFTVYTETGSHDSKTSVVHGEGYAEVGASLPEQSLDFANLRRQMNTEFDAETCYRHIRMTGVRHGKRLQAIAKVYAGDRQALAGLSVPAGTGGLDEYMLHPALMDAAIQAAVCFGIGSGGVQAGLPFAMDRLEIAAACGEQMLAWLRLAKEPSKGTIQKLDIDLCDLNGKICVRIRGLSTRAPLAEAVSATSQPSLPLHALTPVWTALNDEDLSGFEPDSNSRLLLIGADERRLQAVQVSYPDAHSLPVSPADPIERIAESLRAESFDRLLWLAPATNSDAWPPDRTIIDAQQSGVLFLFKTIKALLSAGYGEQALDLSIVTFNTQAVSPLDETDPTHAAVHGLAGSLSKEYPHWTVHLADLDSEHDWPLPAMFGLPTAPGGGPLVYRGGKHGRSPEWYRRELIHIDPLPPAMPAASLYRDEGVYVVIGGAGGLGEVWSRYMVERHRAKIVWFGRRGQDQTISRQLDALSGSVSYVAADARDASALEAAYRDIKSRYPKIHGVVHSAIVLNDMSLSRMDERQFTETLSAKVDISVNLAKVFRKETLDFVLFFSSMQAFSTAPGQSNYAAGCTFKDAFALKLAKQWPYRFSNGSSYHKPVVKVIDWAYWGSIGIVNDDANRERRSGAGDGSIEPQEGMAILADALASPFTQIAPFKALNEHVLAEACGTEDIGAYPESIPAVLVRAEQRFRQERNRLPHARAEWQALAREAQNAELDALLLQLLAATLRSLNLRDRNAALPGYLQRWLQESRRMLDARNEPDNGAAIEALWRQWEQAKAAWLNNPNLKPTVVLLETCMRALPDILTGKTAATDVMFPNGALTLVESVYRGNIVSDYFQQALADFLLIAMRERIALAEASGLAAPKFRILEIGAGTGGTTATVLPQLQAVAESIEEYCYTDLSKAFLLHAQEHYAPGRPFLTTRIFNAELPLAEQNGENVGVMPDRYDFVIAANVLHATQNIRNTLRNAKAALRRNGILLMNELSSHSVLSHLSFGLLEGWWLYRDSALRIPGSPGLYPDVWSDVLTEEGFSEVCLPVADANSLGLQIITAQSDGVVRQKRPPLPVSDPEQAAAEPLPEPAEAEPSINDASLRELGTEFFRERVAETLKMNPRRIDPSKPLEIYGIDSILVVQLANDLRQYFKQVSNTLFFEVRTIDALTDHFIATEKDALLKVLGKEPDESKADTMPSPESKPVRVVPEPHVVAAVSSSVRQGPAVFDVAVIGLSGRYPKAGDIDEFWQRLSNKENCVSEIPAERWDWQAYFDPEKGKAGKMYTRWGGFLDDVDKFDPMFFHISPYEAELMDPQERLLLQCAYEALQDAGYTPENFGGDRKTGVFVGAMNSSYRGRASHFSIANRISYQFDFQGPSMAVDTACSASLTALHVALESLYCGGCGRAIVGGVNLILDPAHFTGLTELGMLSSGPECKSFGANADGFIAAEGVGAVILKPLSEAIADRDNIYGILKGSAINAGGKTNGYTVPNPNAQAAMIAEALNRAGVNAADVGYIEAHGTGTALGDPIEISALSKAFATFLPGDPEKRRSFCAIGSVKSNIGHCESAAGIAGLTKVLLQQRHGQLLPSLHSSATNPDIDFKRTPFAVQQQLSAWPRPVKMVGGKAAELPRIAGISSFGAGGANAHAIIEEYIPEPADSGRLNAPESPAVILLSAKSRDRLRISAERLLQKIRNTPTDTGNRGFNLSNLAYTLQVGREALPHRLGFTAASLQEVSDKLAAFLASADPNGFEEGYLSPESNLAVTVFRTDDDAASMLDAWLAKRKYGKLLELWTLGFDIDWRKLYDRNALPYRISLPVYPFLRERYWFEQQRSEPVISSSRTTAEVITHDPGIEFSVDWEALPASPEQAPIAGRQRILIVSASSSSRFEQSIADYYRDADVILLRADNTTKRLSDHEWLFDIRDESAFETCLEQAGLIGRVYFLSLDESENEDWERLADVQEYNEIQLLRLVKYLDRANTDRQSIDLYLLTLNNYALGGEAILPQGAGLTGLAYAVAQGNPCFAVRNIDLCSKDMPSPAALVRAVVREPASDRGEVVKLTVEGRYRQAFRPTTATTNRLSALRQRGVYVIAGGSGTIGRTLSRYLIEHYQAQVIWLGRSPKSSANVQAALKQLNGKPDYREADATDPNALRAALDRIKADYGAIHGAIYSAMVFDADNSIDHTTEAVFRQILDVKTKGSMHFYRALAGERLDFLCYFSSGQAYAFSGAAKHAAYAGGITFSDALVRSLRRRAAFPVGSINWGFWRASLPQHADGRNFACLSDEEGCACFEHFIAALQQADSAPEALCFRPSEPILALMHLAGKVQPEARTVVKQPGDIDSFVKDALADALAQALKLTADAVDPKLAFAEYGMDSILGVRFINSVNERLRIVLNTAVIYEHSSLSRLAAHILQRYRDKIEAGFITPTEPAPTVSELPRQAEASVTRQLPIVANGDIAVIGMSGQFPGADNIDEFWRKLIQGVDGIGEYPPHYLDRANFYSAEKQPGKSYCKSGGILNGRYRFDPKFFNLSPREARSMNPHQRLVMQEGWKALEDAGYDPNRLSGSNTGIFIGAEPAGYFQEGFTGSSDALVASRLSYHLNLAGPALVVNTGCSSSGVALHLACESLRRGESDLALAGGVNACMNQQALIKLSDADMLSPRGICSTFDASADGTVISEGIGIVVLKRLDDAIADGDCIDGVIRASGMNQDGASNGITAPNGLAQEKLIVDVYKKFGIDPADIAYVEAHGTGTKLGDPVEANALVRAFETFTAERGYCAVGSAKAHIGHTSAAAAAIGLIKTLLSMRYRMLPPLMHFGCLNPLIEFNGSPFFINTETLDWRPRNGKPLTAAINSFGHSGTNAHLVVSEYLPSSIAPADTEQNETVRLIPLSAESEPCLNALVEAYIGFLQTRSDEKPARSATLEEMAYTLQTGRSAMRYRVVFAVSSTAELAEKMSAYLRGETAIAGCWQGTAAKDQDAAPLCPLGTALDELARRWCGGEPVDWAALYRNKAVRRVHLPVYPFEQKEYAPSLPARSESEPVPPQGLKEKMYARKNELQNPELDELLCELLYASLFEAQLCSEPEADGRIALKPVDTGLLPAFYQRWLDESIDTLLERQYLNRRGADLFASKPPKELDALWRQWDSDKTQWQDNPDQCALVGLAEATVRALPAILQGRKIATDVMFPGGSLSLVEGIYRNNLISDYFNEVLSDTLVAAINERVQQDPNASVRILEIGAGTGGTSRGLLKRLRPFGKRIAEYCYTDISKAFLLHAKQQYAPEHAFLTTNILNIDRPVAEQGLQAGGFDFALATNVLHATGNIKRTLANARSALRPGGRLLINEMSGKSLFVHLTFGLLEGWWLYDDPELRIPGIPGLSPEAWLKVLSETGFSHIGFPAEAEHGFGQQIIVAQNGTAPALASNAIEESALAETDGPALKDAICELLVGCLSEALQMPADEIAPDESFADYGLDSLLGINFIRMLNRRLQTDLETVIIFDYNTVQKLGTYIIDNYCDLPVKLKPIPSQPSAVVAVAPEPKLPDERASAPAERKQASLLEPIAIVGMSGRFAGSSNLNELWNNLAAGKDLVHQAERWNLSEFFPQYQDGRPDFCTDAGFIDGIDRFDPMFFKISGAEADYMDPQQRLFLEAAWSALEDAGYAVDGSDEKPYGVFVGYGGSTYAQLFDNEAAPAQAFWGNSPSIIPARIAYFLNIKGPAVTVDTACSGSLVAIHQACQSLWTGEIELALAGGVSLMCTPDFFQTGSRSGMLSPTGRCHSFDAAADGFVPGEGVGVVALKRLSDALADGDPIHGVIRGSGINQDGHTNGITAPSAKSQERLQRDVYERFRIDPAGIQLLEAHGTGTKLGDPIEINALTRSFRAYTDKQGYCALGSIKTNIGHAGPAAGIAGVFKILLAMKHKRIPASLHFEQANPEIRFEGSPFYVNTALKEWTAERNAPRTAALSSFGFSGTNAHLVIEEAPEIRCDHDRKPVWLIALSARNQDQLVRQVEQLVAFCLECERSGKTVDLGNLSYTLLTKRKHWPHRLACVADTPETLSGWLAQWLKDKRVRQIYSAVLDESVREQASLKQLGCQAFETCRRSPAAADYSECLDTVASLYVQGYKLDFQRLFGEGYRTLSLPTYPFARESYWAAAGRNAAPLTPMADQKPACATELSADANRPENEWLFVQEQWTDCPLPDNLDWTERLCRYAGKVIWAVYTDERDKSSFTALLEQLQQAAELSTPLNVHWLHVRDLALKPRAAVPDVVLFLGASHGIEPGEQPSDSDLSAVFSLIQCLMRSAWEEPIRIYYLYESAPALPQLDCEALSGLVGTAMLENPQHRWTLIGCEDATSDATGLQLLIREWLADGAGGLENPSEQQTAHIFWSRAVPEIRYRQSKRQIKQRTQGTFDRTVEPVFGAGKTYLLLGGLGLVGQELCAELAKRYQANLLILSKQEDGPQRQAHCRQLEALGATVHYYSVDATDRDALAQTYAAIKRTFGPIHGVFHLANTVQGGLIAAADWDSFRKMSDIKTRATLYLDELTANEPLDFFILFSSIAAYGIRGSAAYCYACAFMNRFASYRNRLIGQGKRSGNTASLCWGPWTSDPVHANADKDRRQKLEADGFELISIETALPLLERCTGQAQAILGIWAVRNLATASSNMDVQTGLSALVAETPADAPASIWEAKVSAWERQTRQGNPPPLEILAALDFEQIQGLEPELVQRIHRLLYPEQDAPLPAAPPPSTAEILAQSEITVHEPAARIELASVKTAIKEAASELLKVADMDEREAFQNYGMDSVFGVQLAIRLEKKLGQDIPPKWLIDFPTIQALSEHLFEQQANPATPTGNRL